MAYTMEEFRQAIGDCASQGLDMSLLQTIDLTLASLVAKGKLTASDMNAVLEQMLGGLGKKMVATGSQMLAPGEAGRDGSFHPFNDPSSPAANALASVAHVVYSRNPGSAEDTGPEPEVIAVSRF